jgi:hypothetical protein
MTPEFKFLSRDRTRQALREELAQIASKLPLPQATAVVEKEIELLKSLIEELKR